MATDFRERLEHWMSSVEHATGLQLNSKESLVDLLQQVTQRDVPFPKMLSNLHLRFKRATDNKFVYFGRKKFAEIANYIEDRRLVSNGVRLIGNVGSGKSHLLAAYALFLQCCRVRNIADTPRVVYIPNCTDSAPVIYEELLTALQESFSLVDFPELNFDVAENTLARLKSFIQGFVRKQPMNSMIFIYDDWNFYVDAADGTTEREERLWLTALAYRQYCIEALSARTLAQSSGSARSGLECFEVFGGLSDDEWDIWKRSSRFPLLNNLSAEQEEFIKFQTGKIPVILSLLSSHEENSIEKAWDRFTRDVRGQYSGGSWIVEQLRQFEVPPDYVAQYFHMMTYAMIQQCSSQHSERLYDHRFFNYDPRTGIVRPICGFVSCAMTTILEEKKRELFWAQLNTTWVRTGLLSDNRSIRGFAFELFAIGKIIEHYGGLDKVSIERFENDFPLPSMLKPVKPGETIIYWPNKWNLRYVDLIIKNGLSKRSRGGELVVNLIGAQITLETPTEQKDSLHFYETKHCELEDFQRYILEGEHVQHYFHWYVNKKQRAAPQTPAMKALGVTQSVKIINVEW